MGQINQDYVEEYLRSLLPERNELLSIMEKDAMDTNVPIIHPEVGRFLEVMVASHGYKRILEVGTAIGYSAIRFANINKDVQVDTIELNPEMIERAGKYIDQAELNDRIHIHEGDASEVIKNLEGSYDLIFLDGAKGHYVHMLEDCLTLLSPKGMLISDNVLFRGMVASNTVLKRRKITIVKRMRRFLETISTDPRLDTSILPLGDGVSLTIWKDGMINSTGGNPHDES